MRQSVTLSILAALLLCCRFTAFADESEPTPRWFTADIQDANTLGTLLAAQLEDTETLASVQYLRLSGTLGANDITLIKSSLTGLVEVDMQGLTITEIPSQLFYSYSNQHQPLKRVVLPAGLTSIGYQAFRYCKNLEGVVVPATLTKIGDYAFCDCTNLETLDFAATQLESIGTYAFKYANLKTVTFPATLRIIGSHAFSENTALTEVNFLGSTLDVADYYAFAYCSALQTVTLPVIDTLGSSLFYSCKALQTVNLPEGFKTISYAMFYCCSSLSSIVIPSSVTAIGEYAFYDCTALADVTLQEGLRELSYYAFYNCRSLTSITLPSTLVNIYGSPFYSSGVTTLTSKAFMPAHVNGNIFSDSNTINCTLRVPSIALDIYRGAPGWANFKAYEAMEAEGEDKYFPSEISTVREITFAAPATGPEGWKPKADLLFGAGFLTQGLDINTNNEFGRLRVTGENALNLSELTLNYHESYRYNYNATTDSHYDCTYSQVIPQATVTADKVNVRVHFLSGYGSYWNFISFPFDVDLADHDFRETGHYYAIYGYESALRANGESGWVRLADDARLQAGKGYIISVSGYVNGSYSNPEQLVFHSASSAAEPVAIPGADVTVDLGQYPSEYSQNAGWNFIGNPYMSYYDTRFMDFDGPITVRSLSSTTTTYEAFSLVDDSKILVPGEAFFVQYSPAAPQVTFSSEGQQFSRVARDLSASSAPARLKGRSAERLLINLTLTDAQGAADRTRVVLNPAASEGYEPQCDAAKFMAEDAAVAQLSTFMDGIDYAINELPLPQGDIPLRTRTALAGTYTIALGEPRESLAGYTVELVDRLTGRVTDLLQEPCVYDAATGEEPLRFALRITPSLCGIGAIESGSAPADDAWYNLQGIRLKGEPSAPGIYIRGGKKMIVKLVEFVK